MISLTMVDISGLTSFWPTDGAGIWRRHQGARANGDQSPFDLVVRIVGVTEAGFDHPYDSDIEIWLPLMAAYRMTSCR